jgi:proteasome lid subunit RPN8/RPN11
MRINPTTEPVFIESTAARKKFEIINSDPPYEPGERPQPDFKTIVGFSSNWESGYSESHRLYFTREAMSHVHSHIGWEQMTQHNCIEQGGILLGQAFRDSPSGVIYGVVSAAVAGMSARGSSVHLEMTHETWKEMLDSVDKLLEQSPQSELQVIGWYHTHPNGLQVFMSGTDRDTQSRMFAHDWQFAVVLNPQKQRWRAFFGRNSQECMGYVIADDGKESADVQPAPDALPGGEPTDDDSNRATSAEAASAQARPRHFKRARKRLRAWANSPRRLLRLCLLFLLLMLFLQSVIIVMQTVSIRR